MSTPMVDPYSTALAVARHWLPPQEETGDTRQDVLRALTRPHVTEAGKAARRLTVGWIVATPDGGRYRLNAEPLRPLSNSVAPGESIEEAIGDQPIGVPTVVVKLAKSGLTSRNFQPSYGDTLRINEAGSPAVLIDLDNVRMLTKLSWNGRPSARWFHQARRALTEARFGRPEALAELPSPPFAEDPGHILSLLDRMTPEDISYAVALLIRRGQA